MLDFKIKYKGIYENRMLELKTKSTSTHIGDVFAC